MRARMRAHAHVCARERASGCARRRGSALALTPARAAAKVWGASSLRPKISSTSLHSRPGGAAAVTAAAGRHARFGGLIAVNTAAGHRHYARTLAQARSVDSVVSRPAAARRRGGSKKKKMDSALTDSASLALRPQAGPLADFAHAFMHGAFAPLLRSVKELFRSQSGRLLPSDTTRHESAWVDFQVVGDCADEERAVLFPPYSEDVALWVYHPEAAKVRSARARAGTVGALTQVALRSCEGRTRR